MVRQLEGEQDEPGSAASWFALSTVGEKRSARAAAPKPISTRSSAIEATSSHPRTSSTLPPGSPDRPCSPSLHPFFHPSVPLSPSPKPTKGRLENAFPANGRKGSSRPTAHTVSQALPEEGEDELALDVRRARSGGAFAVREWRE